MNNWSMKFKNTIYNSTKIFQIPRKNVNEDVQDGYIKYYKTLIRKVNEDISRWKYRSYLWIERLIVLQCPVSPH